MIRAACARTRSRARSDWQTVKNPVLSAIQPPADNQVVLADGSVCALDGLARDELLALQWQQEREFARQILAAAKGSAARSRATCQAYDSATRILTRVQGSVGRPLVMGMHPRSGGWSSISCGNSSSAGDRPVSLRSDTARERS